MDLPIVAIVHLIEQQDRRLPFGLEGVMVQAQQVRERQLSKERMVEAQVADAPGLAPLLQQGVGDLGQDGGLADAARAGEQDGAFQLRVIQVLAAGLIGKPPERRNRRPATRPPRIEALHDVQDLVLVE